MSDDSKDRLSKEPRKHDTDETSEESPTTAPKPKAELSDEQIAAIAGGGGFPVKGGTDPTNPG